MWIFRALLLAILMILLIAFAYNNFNPDQVVDVHLSPLSHDYVDVPLVTVVFWAFVAGAALALLLFLTGHINQLIMVRNLRRQVKALETELSVLRNRPIEDSAPLLGGADQKSALLLSPFKESLPNG
jgi:uncharacterized membrane protein YciS (DUF1049 family)